MQYVLPTKVAILLTQKNQNLKNKNKNMNNLPISLIKNSLIDCRLLFIKKKLSIFTL